MKLRHGKVTWKCLFGIYIASSIVSTGVTQESRLENNGLFGSRPGALLHMTADPAVQQDIKLSDSKKQAIDKLYQELKAASRNCDCGKSNKDAEDRKAKYEAFLAKAKAFDEKAMSELSSDNLARIQQIAWQEAGPFGLADLDDLTRALNLSDAKVSEIKAVLKKFNEEGKNLLSPKNGAKIDMTAFCQKREEAKERIISVLSDDERAKYKQLLGKPFKRPAKEGNAAGETKRADRSNRSEQ